MTLWRPGQYFSLRHPEHWLPLQQALLCLSALLLVLLPGWQIYLQPEMTRLKNREQEERLLKSTYRTKLDTAVSLSLLQNRLQQASDALQLQLQQRQLAAPGTRDAVLQETAAAAQKHGVILVSAKPGKSDVLADYTTHAVDVRLAGRYHELGRFAAAIAAMPHIVVLNNLQLSVADDGMVVMEATVLSYHRHATSGETQAEPETSEEETQ